MKRLSLLLLPCLFAMITQAQNVTGDWFGAVKIQGMDLRINFHVKKTDAGYESTMDSPDQKAFGIPTGSTTFNNPDLVITLPRIGGEYTAKLEGDKLNGTFKQNGMSFPLLLTHTESKKEVAKRPQDPAKPYPYYEEEVTFTNPKGGHTLAGTLTLPKKEGVYPVVVLITGSGPQNRDEELLGHRPFLVLSDHLTRQGIGVLRFDDRGTAKSGGNFKTATSPDLASDAEAGVAYLMTRQEVDKKKIGLVGHSEGGLIAPMIAAQNKNVAYIVLMAGPGLPGDELLLMQEELIARATGSSESDIKKLKEVNGKAFQMIRTETDTAKLRQEFTQYLTKEMKADPPKDKPAGMSDEAYVNAQVSQLLSPWMYWFLRYDPRPTISRVKCPVLAINGAKDLQVPPKEDLAEIGKALAKGGNKNVTLKEMPGMNHLFQECTTGSPTEYAKIEQTISPLALNTISEWILGVVK